MAAVYNFNAGPSPIPTEVLKKAQEEMFNFEHSGMAVMEMSHRSPLYEKIHFHAMDQIKAILNVPETYEILFLQGGASLQFAMIAMNFLKEDQKAGYVLTGSWSEKAQKEADIIGNTYTLASSKDANYNYIPEVDLSKLEDNTAYIHLTSNNTIFGTQWANLPKRGDVPVIIDMSSDVLSRSIDWDNVDMIYAGAQKNAGMAGVTLVIMKKDLLEKTNSNVPSSLSYKIHAKNQSLYNTPPTGAIYLTGLVADWIEEMGGIHEINRRANEKAALLYHLIDESDGFYKGHAVKDARSNMNVTFKLSSEELEKKFLQETKDLGFVGLNGHRSVGGCRASIYNAVPVEHVKILADFMSMFKEKHQ